MVPSEWCEVDECPVEICGGPHFEVQTSLGTEILKEGQVPMGRRIEQEKV